MEKEILRKRLNLTEADVSDEELLRATEGTALMARINLEIAANELKQAIREEIISMREDIKKMLVGKGAK